MANNETNSRVESLSEIYRRSASIIKQDLSGISVSTPELEIMVGLAHRGLKDLGANFSGDTLFSASVALGHAKVLANLIPKAERIDGGYFVPTDNSDFDSKKRAFAQSAIRAYKEGFRIAEAAVPQEIKEIIEKFYPHWFGEALGISFSPQTLAVMQNPTPMVLPFDHDSSDRKFVGRVMRFPPRANCSSFYNMKGWYLPPTRWVSFNPANDSEALIAYKVARGVSEQVALQELGSHEGAHIFSIDPVVRLAKEGPAHSWVSEAFAQFYGDGEKTMMDRVAQTPELLVPNEVAFREDGSVDYGAGFLLTEALAAKFGGSIDAIPQGMIEVLKRVVRHANLVLNGQAEKAKDSRELLYIIDPDLRSVEESQKVSKIMNEIKKSLLS